MKVFELMKLLSESKAGAEVVVALKGTENVSVEDVDDDGMVVAIEGGDAEVFDDDGDSIGFLSGMQEVEGTETTS